MAVKITLTFQSEGTGCRYINAREDNGPWLQVGKSTRHEAPFTGHMVWTAVLYPAGGAGPAVARFRSGTAAEMEQAVRDYLRDNGRWWT